jgi:hypothetical protein
VLSLLVMVPMMGCQTASIGTLLEGSGARAACKAWPYTPYHSKLDQPDTVAGNRANNRAKKAYCAGTIKEQKDVKSNAAG